MQNLFHEVNWQPEEAERRAFGRTLTVGFLVLGIGLSLAVRWKTGQWARWPLWLGGTCAALGALCWAVPGVARAIYVFWHVVGGLIALIVSSLLLAVVFYLVITPIGLVLRVMGRDPLTRKWDRGAASYWKDAEKSVDAKRYFRQF